MSLESRKIKAMRSVSVAAWCFARRVKARDAVMAGPIKLRPLVVINQLDDNVREARLKLDEAKANAKKKRVSAVQIDTAAEYGWELAH